MMTFVDPKRPTSTAFDALGLRARKAAYAQLGLLDAVLARLAVGPLPSISVKECCAQVGVSEPTFFNYFGTKAGSLMSYVHLWSIQAQWHLARASTVRVGLQGLFDRVAAIVREVPWLMPEIIVFQVRADGAADPKGLPAPPSVATKLLRFPELAGVEALQPLPVQDLFESALERAHSTGELSAGNLDVDLANRLLCSLFFGAAASNRDADRVADTLSRGLDLIWRAFEPVQEDAHESR